MSQEYVTGLISGVAATLVGFGFTMAWDIWKLRREVKRRGRTILRAVMYELEENIAISKENADLLNEEIKILAQGNHLLPAMLPFKHGVWDLLKANLPDELLARKELLAKLRDISFGASHLNEGITSRQTFKDTSGAMSNFDQTLKKRDGILVAEIERFSAEADTALKLFKDVTGEI